MHYYCINNGNKIIILIVLVCSLTCPAGYTVNSDCGCDFTSICDRDNPCMNGGQCIQYSPPDNYSCDCTGTGYHGTNCTGKY